jgi:ankyrin repeat protein
MLFSFWSYCKFGKWKEAIDLLDRGGNIETNNNGLPALIALLKYNADCDECRDVWRRLMGMPDPALYDRNGMSALEYAIAQKHDAFVQETVGRFTPSDISAAFLRAAHEKRPSMVSYFAAKGADVDARFYDGGMTALHMAVCYNDLELIRTVLRCRTNVNLRTEAGQTNLMLCIYRKNADAFRLLLDHGADVDQCNAGGVAPIHLAILENHHDAVRMLLEHGADPTKTTFGGLTPVHYAASVKNIALVDLLTQKYGLSINGRTVLHRTPLDTCLAKMPLVDRPFITAMRARGAEFSLTLFCSHCEYSRVELSDILFLLRQIPEAPECWHSYHLSTELRNEWADWCSEFARTRRALVLFNKRHALLLPADVRGAVASFLREPSSVLRAVREA